MGADLWPAFCGDPGWHYSRLSNSVEPANRSSLSLLSDLLAAWRVLRCHPWATGGIEYIPAKGTWTNREVIELSTNNDRQVIGA